MKPSCAPTEHPTSHDVCWVAGIFEGEGTCNYTKRRSPHDGGRGAVASIAQKDRWILDKVKALFGGSIREYWIKRKTSDEKVLYHRWDITGPRARGFLMTIYSRLSPRRKFQVMPVMRPDLESDKYAI